MALVDDAAHRAAVRQLDAPQDGGRVGVGVEVDDPDVAVAEVVGHGGHVRMRQRVVAAEDDRDDARREDLVDALLDRGVAAGEVGGHALRVPVVDDRDRGERVVLGDPVSVEAQAVDVTCEREGIAEGMPGRTAGAAGSLVED